MKKIEFSLVVILCLTIGLNGQAIQRNYLDSDTSFFLNLATHDFRYFEDNSYVIDFSNIQAPCFVTETIQKKENGLTVNFGTEHKQYTAQGSLYCMYDGKIADPYNHTEIVQMDWEGGFCDRFSNILTSQSEDQTTAFTISYSDRIFEESTLLEYIDDIGSVIVKGKERIRMIPLGRREINVFGIKKELELFRIDEEIVINSAQLNSKNGKIKKLTGFDLSRNFRKLTKRKFIFIDPKTGVDIAHINIKPFQKTIIESIFYRIDVKPKSVLPCKGVNERNVYLFPNPTFGDVFLKFDGYGPGEYSFVVYNIIGKQISKVSFELPLGEEQTKITMPKLTKGTYLYSINNDKNKSLVTRRLSIIRH